MEQSTWGLLQAVMPSVQFNLSFYSTSHCFIRARKTDSPSLPSAQELLSENPYTPTSTLAQAVMDTSPLLSELIVVREWLQETAPLPQHPEATTGYWKFTKYSVMQSLRTGAAHRDGLVRRMDPDAASRDEGRGLASDDAVRGSETLEGRDSCFAVEL